MLIVYSDILSPLAYDYFKRREICLIFTKNLPKLAWALPCDQCANLLKSLKEIIFSQDFILSSRQSSNDFIRNRLLSLPYIILYFSNFIKSCYQTELNKFFNIFTPGGVAIQKVSKAALCKARKKVKYSAFIALNTHTTSYFYDHFTPLTWNGFFLRAVDGSTVQLPNEPDIADHFGAWNPRQGGPCPMARVSQLFDPLNKITVDAIISPKASGERELAAQHFNHLTYRDLILLDRGYPAFWLFKMILSKEANFCCRISTSRWLLIRDFLDTGNKEQIVSFNPPVTAHKPCQKYGLDLTPMTVRLIRVELETGETEVLITSLTDTVLYPMNIFAELYITRWPIEEDYKVIKRRIEIENFSGKSALSVYQDFHARVFSKNITAILTSSAQKTEAEKLEKKSRKINFTQALSSMRDTIVRLLYCSSELVNDMLQDLFLTFLSATEPIRPGRRFPRNHKAKRKFHITYKPTL